MCRKVPIKCFRSVNKRGGGDRLVEGACREEEKGGWNEESWGRGLRKKGEKGG